MMTEDDDDDVADAGGVVENDVRRCRGMSMTTWSTQCAVAAGRTMTRQAQPAFSSGRSAFQRLLSFLFFYLFLFFLHPWCRSRNVIPRVAKAPAWSSPEALFEDVLSHVEGTARGG